MDISTQLLTEQYVLRIPDLSDTDFIYSTRLYPGFHDGMLWNPPQNREELVPHITKHADQWNSENGFSFTIIRQSDQERVGRISIRSEQEGLWDIGYWTHPKFHRQGIMSEVIPRILQFGFEYCGAKSIKAECAIWNVASENLLLKCGFRYHIHHQQGYQKSGQWVPVNEFRIHPDLAESIRQKSMSTNTIDLDHNPNLVWKNDRWVLLLDWDPITIGHALLIPRSHYTDFHDLPESLASEMNRVAQEYIRILKEVFPIRGYSLMLNAGEYNDIKCCHLHIFPRFSSEEFRWQYDESLRHPDAQKFEVVKTLLGKRLRYGPN